ncbi:hypothetical protein Q7C_1144 [Methylophaga frappieri]|uniref:Uncharacterized protein n=1 Tax=Methylophaga frappieri (strain ATCC BAA-2434 / DSM 25690 / JAM7) TaxID=754477 RepID=I1YHA6_METFJ|nr:hypothetical protein Q7C_1144 [Methylophaga frappieri]
MQNKLAIASIEAFVQIVSQYAQLIGCHAISVSLIKGYFSISDGLFV